MGQNLTFSEHGHVAHQIKENHECNDMVANFFSCRHQSIPITPEPVVGRKVQNATFYNMVMMQI